MPIFQGLSLCLQPTHHSSCHYQHPHNSLLHTFYPFPNSMFATTNIMLYNLCPLDSSFVPTAAHGGVMPATVIPKSIRSFRVNDANDEEQTSKNNWCLLGCLLYIKNGHSTGRFVQNHISLSPSLPYTCSNGCFVDSSLNRVPSPTCSS